MLALWRFGSVALVGWAPSPSGVEILIAPVVRVLEHAGLHRRLLSGRRMMGARTFHEIATQLCVQPIEIRLEVAVGDAPDELSQDAIEAAIAPFSIQATDQRAVFLVDIVGFSLLSPTQQALQVSTLEFALNLACAAASKRRPEAEFLRTTTGDGFYVWAAEKGVDADLSLLTVLTVALSVLTFLRRSPAAESAPVLRSCFSVGSHYTYHQPKPDGTADREFIVGAVTIELARLIGAARPHQVLIGDFRRQEQDGRSLDPTEFLERASANMASLRGLNLTGSLIDRIAVYLTGLHEDSGEFRADGIEVVDKHGFPHRCFNMKINVFLDGAEPFYCGLQHRDLLSRD